MLNKWKIITGCVAGTSLLLLAAIITIFSSTIISANTKSNVAKSPTYLFVLSAEQNHIQQIKGSQNHYQLILKNVEKNVLYFSDHPNRVAGELNMINFVKKWGQGSFKNDPPNAIIRIASHNSATNKPKQVAVELMHPKFDKATNTLAFTIKPLAGEPPQIPTTVQGKDVAVFIDGFCNHCGP